MSVLKGYSDLHLNSFLFEVNGRFLSSSTQILE